MENKTKLTTKKIVFTALMAALTTAGSALRITLPLEIAGTTSFHLGNILCALSGLLLGPWLGGLASGIGSMIYDMLNPLYISECWITFLFKGAYGLVAGLIAYSGRKEWNYGKAVLSTVAGALTYAVLYLAKSFFYNGRGHHRAGDAAGQAACHYLQRGHRRRRRPVAGCGHPRRSEKEPPDTEINHPMPPAVSAGGYFCAHG